MNQKEFGKGFTLLPKGIHNFAVQQIQKREEQEVKEALQSSIDKKEKANDEFHKFVRSL